MKNFDQQVNLFLLSNSDVSAPACLRVRLQVGGDQRKTQDQVVPGTSLIKLISLHFDARLITLGELFGKRDGRCIMMGIYFLNS